MVCDQIRTVARAATNDDTMYINELAYQLVSPTNTAQLPVWLVERFGNARLGVRTSCAVRRSFLCRARIFVCPTLTELLLACTELCCVLYLPTTEL